MGIKHYKQADKQTFAFLGKKNVTRYWRRVPAKLCVLSSYHHPHLVSQEAPAMPCETSLCLTLLLIESKPLWRRPCHTQIVRSHMRAAFLPSLGAGQEELKLARSLQSSSHSGHCSKWNHSIFRVTVKIIWAISGFPRKTAVYQWPTISSTLDHSLLLQRP